MFTQPNEIHAAKLGDRSATSGFLQSSGALIKIYLSLLVALAISVVLSFFLIGIPFVLMILWAMFRMPFWKDSILAAAQRGGIEVKRVVSL